MSYHRFKSDDGDEYGSFEVFHFDPAADAELCLASEEWTDSDGELLPAGYYWWACCPGCMPDGDPVGPFDTEEEAMADAMDL